MTALLIRYGAAAPLPVEMLLTMIPSLPRAALARMVDGMIDELDMRDGGSDIEEDDPAECEARDDGCGPILLRGQIVWGSDWSEQGV